MKARRGCERSIEMSRKPVVGCAFGVALAGCVTVGLIGPQRTDAQPGSAGLTTARARGIYEEGRDLAAKFNVLLVRGGRERRVSTDYDFRSGDRMKFELELNRPAFVYVLNRTFPGDARRLQSRGIEEVRDDDRRNRRGDRRQYTLLYPRADSRPAALPANRPVRLPRGDRVFVMDDEPGLERLYVMVSEQRLDIDDYFDLNGRQRTRRRPGGGGSADDDVLDQLNANLASASANGSTVFARGIVEEDDGDYGIVEDADGPYTVEVNLRHLR